MLINGEWKDNITCPICKFRHPSELSCKEAESVALEAKIERETTIEPPVNYEVYLGDGVYADFDGYHIVLKANDNQNPTDTIYLDPAVLRALSNYIERLGL
jgi:hypothetical protein